MKPCGSRENPRRKDHEQPAAIAEWGWRFHHVGIPTDERRPGERYVESCGLYVSGFDTSPYGVEWMRFEPGSEVDDLVRTRLHVAFEVDDLDAAIDGKTLIGDVSSPSAGVRVAMIRHDDMAIELIEFSGSGQDVAGRDR